MFINSYVYVNFQKFCRNEAYSVYVRLWITHLGIVDNVDKSVHNPYFQHLKPENCCGLNVDSFIQKNIDNHYSIKKYKF
jgi:hypothetical protein